MRTTEYHECRNCGTPYNRYLFGADPKHKDALVSDGDVLLSEVPSLVALRGQIYQCDISTTHTVQPVGSSLTATLALRGPQRSATTAIYRKPGLSADQPSQPITTTETLKILDDVISDSD